MGSSCSLFLALRYLRPKRSFVSIIPLLSILGPVLGVAILIIVIAVMAGFVNDIKMAILGTEAHIQLRPYRHSLSDAEPFIKDPKPFLARLDELNFVAAPVVQGFSVVQTSKTRLDPKIVKGILPEWEKHVTAIADSMQFGRFDIGEEEALIPIDMASDLGLGIGDKFQIHSASKLRELFTYDDDGNISPRQNPTAYLPEEVTVAGVFEVGMYEFDSAVVIVHLEKADDLFGLSWGGATGIQIKTADPFDLEPAVDRLRADPAFAEVDIITWMEARKKLLDALMVERNMMFFLLIFIIIVAAFAIAITLITVAVQKTREIGVLKALGATHITIFMVFLLQGAIVGLIGTVLGTGLGLVIVDQRDLIADLMAQFLKIEIFPRRLYQFRSIPALVQFKDLATIAGSAFVICVLGAVAPAIYAAAMTPTQALRSENQ